MTNQETTPQTQLNLTIVALVALVAIVGLVALVMNAPQASALTANDAQSIVPVFDSEGNEVGYSLVVDYGVKSAQNLAGDARKRPVVEKDKR